MESYIALEMEFLTFITQIRAVYDSWLKQVGQTKLVSVSLSGTLADTLQEVGICVCVCVCVRVCVCVCVCPYSLLLCSYIVCSSFLFPSGFELPEHAI